MIRVGNRKQWKTHAHLRANITIQTIQVSDTWWLGQPGSNLAFSMYVKPPQHPQQAVRHLPPAGLDPAQKNILQSRNGPANWRCNPVKSVENNSTPTSMQHIQKYLVGYSIELKKSYTDAWRLCVDRKNTLLGGHRSEKKPGWTGRCREVTIGLWTLQEPGTCSSKRPLKNPGEVPGHKDFGVPPRKLHHIVPWWWKKC